MKSQYQSDILISSSWLYIYSVVDCELESELDKVMYPVDTKRENL